MTPTIYTVGDGNIFQQGLIGVSMVFGNGLFTSSSSVFGLGQLVGLGLLISLTLLIVTGIMKQKLQLEQLFVMIIVYMLLFVPTTSVNVESLDTGAVYGPTTNIPIGIAYPSSWISSAAVEISNEIGTAFQNVAAESPPVDLDAGGFAGPLQQLLAIRSLYSEFYSGSFYTVESTMAYMRDCYVPAISLGNTSGPPTLDTVLNSQNAASELFSSPPTGVTTVYSQTGGQSVNCASAASSIQAGLTSYFDDQNTSAPQNNLLYALQKVETNVGSKASSTANASNELNNLGTNIQSLVGNNISDTATEGLNFLENDIFGCLISSGLQYARSPTEPWDTSSMPSYCSTTTSVLDAQQVSNATSASVFQANMIPAMALLQFLFLALSPIIAVVAVATGLSGFKTLGNYLLFGAWTQSWIPIAEVINDYSQMSIQNAFTSAHQAIQAAFNNSGPVNTIDPAVYWDNIAGLSQFYDKLQNVLSNADFMLSATPIITFALLSGSMYALTTVGQDVTARNEVSTGTGLAAPSLGHQAMFGTVGSGSAYTSTYAGDGSSPGSLSTLAEQTTGGFTVSHATSMLLSQAQSAQARASNSMQSSMEQTASATTQASTGTRTSDSVGWGENDSFSRTLQTAEQTTDGLTKGLNLSDSAKQNFTVGLAAGISGGLGLGAAVSAALKASSDEQISGDQAEQIQSRAQQQDSSSDGTNQSYQVMAKNMSEAVKSQGGQLSDSYSNLSRSMRSYSQATDAVSSINAQVQQTNGAAGEVRIDAATMSNVAASMGGAGVLAGTLQSRLSPEAAQQADTIAASPAFRASQGANASEASIYNNAVLTLARTGSGDSAVSAQSAVLSVASPQAWQALGPAYGLASQISAGVGEPATSAIGGAPSIPSSAEATGTGGNGASGNIASIRAAADSGLARANAGFQQTVANRQDKIEEGTLAEGAARGHVADDSTTLVGGVQSHGETVNAPTFQSDVTHRVQDKIRGTNPVEDKLLGTIDPSIKKQLDQ